MSVPSALHMFKCFSLLCSAVCFYTCGSFSLHVSLNMMFSDTLGIFYSIYYICSYLWIFFSDSFFTENILHVCVLKCYFQLFMF